MIRSNERYIKRNPRIQRKKRGDRQRDWDENENEIKGGRDT